MQGTPEVDGREHDWVDGAGARWDSKKLGAGPHRHENGAVDGVHIGSNITRTATSKQPQKKGKRNVPVVATARQQQNKSSIPTTQFISSPIPLQERIPYTRETERRGNRMRPRLWPRRAPVARPDECGREQLAPLRAPRIGSQIQISRLRAVKGVCLMLFATHAGPTSVIGRVGLAGGHPIHRYRPDPVEGRELFASNITIALCIDY